MVFSNIPPSSAVVDLFMIIFYFDNFSYTYNFTENKLSLSVSDKTSWLYWFKDT